MTMKATDELTMRLEHAERCFERALQATRQAMAYLAHAEAEKALRALRDCLNEAVYQGEGGSLLSHSLAEIRRQEARKRYDPGSPDTTHCKPGGTA